MQVFIWQPDTAVFPHFIIKYFDLLGTAPDAHDDGYSYSLSSPSARAWRLDRCNSSSFILHDQSCVGHELSSARDKRDALFGVTIKCTQLSNNSSSREASLVLCSMSWNVLPRVLI